MYLLILFLALWGRVLQEPASEKPLSSVVLTSVVPRGFPVTLNLNGFVAKQNSEGEDSGGLEQATLRFELVAKDSQELSIAYLMSYITRPDGEVITITHSPVVISAEESAGLVEQALEFKPEGNEQILVVPVKVIGRDQSVWSVKPFDTAESVEQMEQAGLPVPERLHLDLNAVFSYYSGVKAEYTEPIKPSEEDLKKIQELCLADFLESEQVRRRLRLKKGKPVYLAKNTINTTIKRNIAGIDLILVSTNELERLGKKLGSVSYLQVDEGAVERNRYQLRVMIEHTGLIQGYGLYDLLGTKYRLVKDGSDWSIDTKEVILEGIVEYFD